MSSSPPKNTDTTSHQQTSTVPNETNETNNNNENEKEITFDFNDPVVVHYWDVITRFLRGPSPSYPFQPALLPENQQVVRNIARHFKLRVEMVQFAEHRYIVLYKDPQITSHWE